MDAGQINELLQPKLNEIRHYLIKLGASPSDAEDILKVLTMNSSGKNKQYKILKQSYSPQAVAMMVYDNPTEQNKQLQRYVDKYVRKLMT